MNRLPVVQMRREHRAVVRGLKAKIAALEAEAEAAARERETAAASSVPRRVLRMCVQIETRAPTVATNSIAPMASTADIVVLKPPPPGAADDVPPMPVTVGVPDVALVHQVQRDLRDCLADFCSRFKDDRADVAHDQDADTRMWLNNTAVKIAKLAAGSGSSTEDAAFRTFAEELKKLSIHKAKAVKRFMRANRLRFYLAACTNSGAAAFNKGTANKTLWPY